MTTVTSKQLRKPKLPVRQQKRPGKAVRTVPNSSSVSVQPCRKASQLTARHPDKAATVGRGTKQARVIAMLRAPGGATIGKISAAAGWQPHSVRGFLAGVIKKKLSLTLVSALSGDERIYRITGGEQEEPAAAAQASSA